MKLKKIVLFAIPSLALILLGAGCEADNSTANIEQSKTEVNQSHLLEVQPPPKLDWSLERDNIIKRETLWNNPNKVSYIYLINYGRIMAFYTIKGKVTSVDSQITNTEQLATRWSGDSAQGSSHWIDGTLPSPSEDGSYGTNGTSIFFFTTDGAYIEWHGDYMLADQPLQMTSQPELIRSVK